MNGYDWVSTDIFRWIQVEYISSFIEWKYNYVLYHERKAFIIYFMLHDKNIFVIYNG